MILFTLEFKVKPIKMQETHSQFCQGCWTWSLHISWYKVTR
jgi:hypothetical protein